MLKDFSSAPVGSGLIVGQKRKTGKHNFVQILFNPPTSAGDRQTAASEPESSAPRKQPIINPKKIRHKPSLLPLLFPPAL